MNKKLLELLDSINQKKTLVQSLAEAGKLEEAEAAKKELVDMQRKFDLLKDIEDAPANHVTVSPDALAINTAAIQNGYLMVEPAADERPVDAVRDFANAARHGFRNAMTEGTAAEGGYTVPEDIQTKIEEYRDAKASLIDLVDVENVTTNKGARTFKKRSQQTGFTLVGEGAKIGAKDTPQFERLAYEIKKYAGYFPVTNELLEDSDANIAGTLIRWIGDESRVTRNKLILAAIKPDTTTSLTGLDDIKKVLNVTLGQAFKPTSRIVTNDDGLQYLDTLKDANGRDLLQPNPTEPAKLQLRVGATVVPISVMPNADLASDGTKVPFIIGDLKEAVKFFDRKQMTIMTSNTAAIGDLNAFEQDLTVYRAIEREDVQVKDAAAYVYGELDTAASDSTEA